MVSPVEFARTTPETELLIAFSPETSSPMTFPSITSPEVPLVMSMPSPKLPEMRFAAAAVVPPIVVPIATARSIPSPRLGTAAVPSRSVPILLPATSSSSAGEYPSRMAMPGPSFPEIRLPVPAIVPPIVLPIVSIWRPMSWVPSAAVPARFVPISFPSITLSPQYCSVPIP